MNSFQRPDWDTYFMQIAQVTKKRTNCIRLKVGAVVVKDRTIIGTGYNGTPYGIKNCFEGGCVRCLKREKGEIGPGEDKEKCICVHAEQNAILQSAYHGISTKGATLYTTTSPCIQCSKMILNAGISEVVASETHSDSLGEKLLLTAGVKMKIVKKEA